MKRIFSVLTTAALLPLSLNVLAASTECDSHYLADTGDGTIIDFDTGLMWTQCTLGQTRSVDSVSGEVSCSFPDNPEPLDVTTRTDSALASTSVPSGYFATAGHTDWRIPNIKEMWSIVDTCNGIGSEGFVNATFFPDQISGETQNNASSYFPDHFGTSTPAQDGILGRTGISVPASNICIQLKDNMPEQSVCDRSAFIRFRLVRNATTADFAALPVTDPKK